MSFDAHMSTIGELLSSAAPPLRVPEYQRGYSWDTTDVDYFWKDIKRFDDEHRGASVEGKSYFVGALVLVKRAGFLEVLDGQQRLATTTILLASVRDLLAQADRSEEARDLQSQFIGKKDWQSGKTAYQIVLGKYDRDFFRESIQAFPRPASFPDSTHKAHDLITKARSTIDQYVSGYCGDITQEDGYQKALRLWSLATKHIAVVEVVSDEISEAETVFESLNDRGVGLSSSDLIRNFLLQRSIDETERTHVVDVWGNILGLCPPPAKIDDVLRFYWITREGDEKSRSLHRAIRDGATKAGLSSTAFIDEVQDAAEAYQAILDGKDDRPALAFLFRGAIAIGARALFPAFIALDYAQSPPWSTRVAHALVSLYVRHTVIGGGSNSTLENWVFAIAKAIRDGETDSAILARIAAVMPPDPVFERDFSTAVVPIKAARYLLEELEIDKHATDEYSINAVQVDHIYPQKPREGFKWSAKQHELYLPRLGNLTLLDWKLNPAARNAPWDEKRSKHYVKSELKMVKALQGRKEWTFKQVEERQRSMARDAVRIWNASGTRKPAP